MESPLSVTEVTKLIKNCLESRFGMLIVTGEISGCKYSSTGHCYLSLKDSKALLPCALFKNVLPRLTFAPKDGQKVTVYGSINLWESAGKYQLTIQKMTLAGEGEILALLEQRKRQLASEGLFDSDRKKSLPFYPHSVALITSPKGAAIQDILNILKRRRPDIQIKIFPAVVQGEMAAPALIEQIQRVNHHQAAEVIILGRGGGSIEDLLPFSDEAVVRAVATSKIPIISAVGHEIDWALCDFAADLRVPTPSAAAERLSITQAELLSQVRELTNRLKENSFNRLRIQRQDLARYHLTDLTQLLQRRIENYRLQADHLVESLLRETKSSLAKNRHRLQILQKVLEENSPQRLQEKGLVRIASMEGKILNSATQLEIEKSVMIQLVDGEAIAQIRSIKVK